jgi:signal transduction histidine kinase
MAHELRNPLTSMKILVQGAADGQDGGANGVGTVLPGPVLGGSDLTILEEEIERLERLTQAFLDYARPPKLERRVVDIRPLVDQTIQLVSRRASLSGVHIDFHPPDGPCLAAVDAGQLRQVVLNLVLNALDAMTGGGRITIRLEAGPGDWLTLVVADTGCGLPTKLGNRIFMPFTTTKENGMGLGLSICQRITEAHGGTIHGENRPEGGAVFTVRLPLAGGPDTDR